MKTSTFGGRSRRSPLLLALALGMAACAGPEQVIDEPDPPPAVTGVPDVADPPPDETLPTESTSTLTEDGWGPIRIGMTRAEVVAAAGEDANPEAVGGPEPEMCDQFRPEQAPRGLLVMVERDTVTRISLSQGTEITTDRGFGVGDRADAVREAYGSEAEITPHKYSSPPAEYITVWATAAGEPDARGIVYEIGTDGRVQQIHAGGPSIQYVEGCL